MQTWFIVSFLMSCYGLLLKPKDNGATAYVPEEKMLPIDPHHFFDIYVFNLENSLTGQAGHDTDYTEINDPYQVDYNFWIEYW